jgi:hypothetical protein
VKENAPFEKATKETPWASNNYEKETDKNHVLKQ